MSKSKSRASRRAPFRDRLRGEDFWDRDNKVSHSLIDCFTEKN